MSKGVRGMTGRVSYLALAVLGASALGGALAFGHHFRERAESKVIRFEGSRADALRFMEYHRSIRLTPDQEAVRQEALAAMPAPCCSDFSADTCCCRCNLARTIWGLSNFAIAQKGLDVTEVREVVGHWLDAVNPSGFPGDTCSKGACGRSFERGGCGGMHQAQLIY